MVHVGRDEARANPRSKCCKVAALVRALLHMRCADESRYYCTALVVKYGITTRHSAR